MKIQLSDHFTYKRLFRFVLPTVAMIIFMSIYSIVDGFFVSNFAGKTPFAAVNLVMPVLMILSTVGFHFGAGNTDELKGLLKKSLVICAVVGVIMVIAAELLAVPLADLFVGYDAELKALTVSGFRIFALCFAFIGFGIFTSGFFTALSDGVTSAIISFARTLVLEAAAVILLPLVFGIDGIWYATLLAEALSMALGVVFLIAKRRKYQY